MTDELPKGAAVLTQIMLTVFRVHGRLLERGDQLVKPLQLTSARWQVLGAVAQAGKPLAVPEIAETMGMSRQGAQKQVRKLEEEGFLEQRSNPRHHRSTWYVLTDLGKLAIDQTKVLQARWAHGLANGVDSGVLQVTLQTLQALLERLDAPLPSAVVEKR